MKLNQQELQNLRHLIGIHSIAEKKLNEYASQCSDSQVKQMFQESARSAAQTRQKLMSFLS
ncbi:hypothetical protein SAMN02745221_00118 [Thermosyntropha lipolytica DSM 11003]|uniref:Coat F domain-containing protein n=1 Tax=Thermosyntropha lipolytica DSM 11003 TaxID=1123382 RepID=A0A1M5JHC5_9FIRM|nr:hypothetical protein [Thermosyntropha lipolytica]SHG39805.1 hypothetical protein SAMN02745221_00118 [Thermosyntropha lipolytica DSM 11003]